MKSTNIKRFPTLHSRLTEHLQTCIAVGKVSTWWQWKTTLIQKSPEKDAEKTGKWRKTNFWLTRKVCVANQVKRWCISGYPVLSQSKYRIQHDIVDKQIHLLLLKEHGIPTGNKWCCHAPNVVTETDDGKVKIYQDKPIKNDRKVSYNRSDPIVVDREENTWHNVHLKIPMGKSLW